MKTHKYMKKIGKINDVKELRKDDYHLFELYKIGKKLKKNEKTK
jgi:hypothetical protein